VARVENVRATAGLTLPVAVIGGGWAGCAAAVVLTRAGYAVTIFEAAPTLGGRARRVARDGLPLDNGQHLLLGAYARVLELLAIVHDDAQVAPMLARRPLTLLPFSPAQPNAITLVRREAPGSLGLAIALLRAQGLTWRERCNNLTWFLALKRQRFARPAEETVAELLAPLPNRVAQRVWAPLCLAALNTPIAFASAQVFANVLRAAFAERSDASDFILPETDLTTLFPEAASTYLGKRGGEIHLGNHARVVAADAHSATLAATDGQCSMAAAIIAVGPHQLPDAFAPGALASMSRAAAAVAATQALTYEPIVTVWLGLATPIALPAPMARLDDAPGQWIFDRPDVLARAIPNAARPPIAQLLAVIISTDGPHMKLPHAELAASVVAQIRRLSVGCGPCVWSKVIAEKRATYACKPQRARPAGPTLGPTLFLAGDYLDATYPATLEAAVRSGIAAAEAFLATRSRISGSVSNVAPS